MALKDIWIDKMDMVDIVSAEDINQIAHSIIDLEEKMDYELSVTREKFRGIVDGSVTEITADDLAGFTYIRSGAFSDTALQNIDIPDTVISIGASAFSGTKLEKVTIPDSVTSIGTQAFAYCPKLTDITIGRGVLGISLQAFAYCGYDYIEHPDGWEEEVITPIVVRFLREIPPFAYHFSVVFEGCEIERIEIPKGSFDAWASNYYTKDFADKFVEV